MRTQNEIKFSDSHIDDKLRIKTLRFLANLDIRIHYTYLRCCNIPLDYWHKDELQSGHLYTRIIGETVEMYTPTNENVFQVFCDHRHLKRVKVGEFKSILRERIMPLLPHDSLFQISMLDSINKPNIQIADWITGALARYVNKKNLGEECYVILKNNLLGGKELFVDYWQNKQKTQSSD